MRYKVGDWVKLQNWIKVAYNIFDSNELGKIISVDDKNNIYLVEWEDGIIDMRNDMYLCLDKSKMRKEKIKSLLT